MTIDLKSVLSKIGRAHDHSQTVKDEVKIWKDGEPYLITREVNADSSRYSLVAHIGVEPPLERWSLIIADAIHNLRCSLDHLVYAIAVHESGQNPPPNETLLAFPLCSGVENFRGEEARRLKHLSAEVRAAIEKAQPYNRTHKDLPPPLTILRYLDDVNKHRLVHLAFAGVAKGDIGFTGDAPNGTQVRCILHSGEVKDGTEVVAYVVDPPNPGMKFDRYEFLIVVALYHGKRDPAGPDGSDRNDFASVLSLLIKEVRDVVNVVCSAVK